MDKIKQVAINRQIRRKENFEGYVSFETIRYFQSHMKKHGKLTFAMLFVIP